MNATEFFAGDKFALFIDLRSMKDNDLHGSGMRLVNTKDGVHLSISRTASGSGNAKCHIFILADAQLREKSLRVWHTEFLLINQKKFHSAHARSARFQTGGNSVPRGTIINSSLTNPLFGPLAPLDSSLRSLSFK